MTVQATNKTAWQEAQTWELKWHLNQQFNTFNEEQKQFTYASLMGLDKYKTNYYNIIGWDFGEKSILDIGGGEVSMLLKSNAKRRVVVDPLNYPEWVKMRYKEAGIEFVNVPAEEMEFEETFDEVFIYNCLQHTISPEQIIKNAKKVSKIIRIFEWCEGVSEGHIHALTEESLNKWLGGNGKAGYINQYPCVGNYYAGVFKGDLYE